MTRATHPPTVSVVLTALDRPHYLEIAVRSVLAQTYSDFEVLIAEDGGTAHGERLVDSLADPRVRCIRNETSLGVVQNVRNAVAATSGALIAIMNDDDAWEPELLAHLTEPLLDDRELVLAFSDHSIMGAEGRVDDAATEASTERWGRTDLTPGRHQPFWDLALVRQTVPTVMACVMRRDAVDWEQLPLEAGGHYDIYVAYLASREGRGAYYIPRRLSRYRVHGAMQSVVGTLRNSRALAHCLRTFMDDPQLIEHRDHFRRGWLSTRVTHGLALLRFGDRRAARRELRAVLRDGVSRRALQATAIAHMPSGLGTWLMRIIERRRR